MRQTGFASTTSKIPSEGAFGVCEGRDTAPKKNEGGLVGKVIIT